MSDVEQTTTEETTTGTPDEAKNTETPGPVPYERFQEVNSALKELKSWKEQQEAEAAKRQKEAAKAEEARLAEQQKYQELAEQRASRIAELEPLSEKVEKYEAALNDYLKKELGSVPDYVKPLLEDRDPVAQLTYIAEHRTAWGKPTPPDINDKPGSGGKGSGRSEEDLKAEAVRLGINPELYVKTYNEQFRK